MRKFTKEITTLLAAAAMGTTMGAAPAEVNNVRTAGTAMNPDCAEEPVTTENVAAQIGTYVTTVPLTTTVTTTTMFAGTTMTEPSYIDTYTTTEAYFAGGIMDIFPLYEDTTTTTAMTVTEPSFIGTTVMTEETTTAPPVTTMPPFMGDVGPMDGDVNMDGVFSLSDVVTFQRYLLNVPDIELSYWQGADRNHDGTLDVFDLIVLKRELINNG